MRGACPYTQRVSAWSMCSVFLQVGAARPFPLPPIFMACFLFPPFSILPFSKFDLRSCYHQLKVEAGEKFKTAFKAHAGHFIFRPFLRNFVTVYFDDIFLYSSTLQDHFHDWRLRSTQLESSISTSTGRNVSATNIQGYTAHFLSLSHPYTALIWMLLNCS